jgi:hypothetical protein
MGGAYGASRGTDPLFASMFDQSSDSLSRINADRDDGSPPGRMRETTLICDGWSDSDLYSVLVDEWDGEAAQHA